MGPVVTQQEFISRLLRLKREMLSESTGGVVSRAEKSVRSKTATPTSMWAEGSFARDSVDESHGAVGPDPRQVSGGPNTGSPEARRNQEKFCLIVSITVLTDPATPTDNHMPYMPGLGTLLRVMSILRLRACQRRLF